MELRLSQFNTKVLYIFLIFILFLIAHCLIAHAENTNLAAYISENAHAASISISFGQTISDSLAVGESDTFTFSASAGNVVMIRMSCSSGLLDPEVQLYGPDGTKLYESWGGSTADIVTTGLPTSGTYTIVARDHLGTYSGNYNLSLERLNPGTGTAISLGQTVSGDLVIGDLTTFTFSASAGNVVMIRMSCSSGLLDPEVQLYGPDGTKLYESWDGSTADIVTTGLPTSGTYTIVARDHLGTYSGNYILYLRSGEPCQISLSTSYLNFGSSTKGTTSSQSFRIRNSGGRIMSWTVKTDSYWVSCSPKSGIDNAEISVTIDPYGLSVGTHITKITVNSAEAINSPQYVQVTLKIYPQDEEKVPFGLIDTPAEGASGIEGAIPVTGWALDDIEVTKVEIKRDPHPSDNPVVIGPDGLVYIGDAVFVEGARPDVEQLYPTYPLAYRAGWGYMLLTNFLPNQGNGTYRIHAIAYDKEGHRVTLGTKTIHCDNAHATYPFGTIDTPTQGGQASGSSYVNFAWALTPQPKYIPTDGSTILVWIDGVPQPGHPSYNHYRSDIATLFPGYANTNGAVGYYYIDTTKLVNGVHTIAWSVVDSAGVAAGIGSRYFTVLNTGAGGLGQVDLSQIKLTQEGSGLVDFGPDSSSLLMMKQGKVLRMVSDLEGVALDLSPIYVRSGYNLEAMSEPAFADSEGWFQVKMGQADRVEVMMDFELKERMFKDGLLLGLSSNQRSGIASDVSGKDLAITRKESSEKWFGYLVVGEELRPLPIGSFLDSEQGVFFWQPGPAFFGDYTFMFVKLTNRTNRDISLLKKIKVSIGSN